MSVGASVSPAAEQVMDVVAWPLEKSKFDSDSETDSDSPVAEEDEAPVAEEDEMVRNPSGGEDVESDEEDAGGLPVYYAGMYGCRPLEEFEFLGKIGEGAYGVVYRAKEKRTDEIVALKRVKIEDEREGFPITSLREIDVLLTAGRHENIVNLREVVVNTSLDKIYLCMEFVEKDVQTFLASSSGPLPIGQVKSLLTQLLSGVQHLHDNWILHRDLKPSNLLLTRDGLLKIGDFGLSRKYGSPIKPYTPLVVSLWYRAPELLLAAGAYSTSVDLWSVGCIFAEFLTRQTLLPGRGEVDQVRRIFHLLGTPSAVSWPAYASLRVHKTLALPYFVGNKLRDRNFLALCATNYYDECLIHRNIKGFMVQMGDPSGTGKGGKSIWGTKFEDEFREELKHDNRGVVSMANNGPDSNKAQFFITYAKAPHLDLKNTVFGKVIDGNEALDELEKLAVDDKYRPKNPIRLRNATIHANPIADLTITS